MKRAIFLSLILTMLAASAALAQTASPTFVRFPAKVKTSKNIRVDLKSHKHANRFRTNLRNAARDGINFAGRFVLASWGCGTNCTMSAVIDSANGRVYFPEQLEGVGFGFCDLPDEAEAVVFRRDSRLLVINGYKGGDLNKDDPECGIYFYEWTGSQLRQVKFDKRARREGP